jgi:hypothetical protein
MSKNKEEEIENEEDSSNVCFIEEYEILTDKRQFIVKAPKGGLKNAPLLGYFKTLSGAIAEIRDQEMRRKILKSKTLEIVIDKLVEFDREFARLLAPLKKLEDK